VGAAAWLGALAQNGLTESRQETMVKKSKSLAVQAMFSDDQLLEDLVLKGGNAMALIHLLSSRASVVANWKRRANHGSHGNC
jgi:hypothetical protein